MAASARGSTSSLAARVLPRKTVQFEQPPSAARGSSTIAAATTTTTMGKLMPPSQQHQQYLDGFHQHWNLRFVDRVMERRFQLYHEEMSLRSSVRACSYTFWGLLVMQAGAFYSADMDKHIWTTFGRLNEAIALGGVEPFYGSVRHS